jgi:hypothetical protein
MWDALAAAHPAEHATLLLRVNELELPSPVLAERVGERLGRPMPAATALRALQRGHGDFAKLLVFEVSQSLGEPTTAELETDLRDVDLLNHCGSALAAWRWG